MKNKKYLFLLLIFLVSIVAISAVSATDDFSSDINSGGDNQELSLEETPGEEISTSTNDNEELSLADETNDDVLSSTDNDEKVVAGNSNKNANEKTVQKTVTKKSAKKTSKKATAPSSSKKTTFKTISKGFKDKAMVKKIQKALKKNGYYLRYKGHYLKVDGWYGPCTFRSVKQFQKAKGLKVTGKVDEKTAEKLKVIDKSNAVIKFENDRTFKGEYNSGKSFEAKIVNKSSGKGIETILRVDYYKNGKKVGYEEYYCTDEDGINYITPDELKVGTYTAKVSCNEGKVKAIAKTRTITIAKTSISLKAANVKASGNEDVQLKASLKFQNNRKVNEGKVKFTIDGKSYVVKVKNGVAVKKIKSSDIKSNKYKVEFLGTKNIKAKSANGKIK